MYAMSGPLGGDRGSCLLSGSIVSGVRIAGVWRYVAPQGAHSGDCVLYVLGVGCVVCGVALRALCTYVRTGAAPPQAAMNHERKMFPSYDVGPDKAVTDRKKSIGAMSSAR